jgi:two-component system nitrate/nitrite response regulator NarL
VIDIERRKAAEGSVRIVLVEDHPLYRYALEQSLSAAGGVTIVGSYGDGVAGLRGIRAVQPPVALLDLDLPLMSGLNVLRELSEGVLLTRVLVLSGSTREERAREAFEAGAKGYICKNLGAHEIRDAILMVARGETVAGEGVHDAERPGHDAGPPSTGAALSSREREILALAARGLSRDVMGRELHLSPATVKAHLAQIYRKLGASGRAAAVATAIRSGLL